MTQTLPQPWRRKARRTGCTALVAGALVLVPAAERLHAEPLFASPPHFLSLHDRQQVVFFINEPVVGALASRDNNAVEVMVPRALVDPTIRGMTFRDDDSAAVGATSVGLEPGAGGNAAIRITTSAPLGGVHAYSEDDPPRLIVDLLASGPQPTATPGRRITSATATHAPLPSPRATRTPEPGTTAKPARSVPAPQISPSVTASPAPVLGALHATIALATDARAATDAAPAGDPAVSFPCDWRRVSGIPFCAPDPKAPAYIIRPDVGTLVQALATTVDGAALPAPPSADDDAIRYLAADRELVSRAASGHLLPAIDAYRLALRRAPRFFDASRARLNVALVYRTLGFAAELGGIATEVGADAIRPIVDALMGDLAREQGALDRARDAYARAAAGGGGGACLAARGRAALALADERAADAAAELARLPALCPAALRNDPETMQVQARRQIAAGDARAALTTLDAVRRAFGPNRQGGAFEDVAAASLAAGDVAGARQAYEQLASGRYGARLAERGTLGLAHLDAAGGDVAAGFRRLDGLSPDTATAERRRFALTALSDALRRGADQTAVSIVFEQGIAASSLTVEDQIRLARAMRIVGLADEAESVLRGVRDGSGSGGSDALWEERGASALAADEPAQALAIADDWLRVRGATTPAGALALRALALASLGQSARVGETVKRAAATLDPIAARALRLDVAGRVRSADPALAARLVREALAEEHAPPLEDPAAAAALRLLAETAEGSGDDAAALAAYSSLSARYPDQPSAVGAAYRMARLTAGAQGGAAARAAYAEIAHSPDALERRMGAAAEAYEVVVKPFENREAP